MDAMLVLALLITFVGTILYSVAWPTICLEIDSGPWHCHQLHWTGQVTDFTMRYNGAIFAVSNAVLVAGMCTYERYLMTSANLGMSAIDINFHRVAGASVEGVQPAYVTCGRGVALEVLSMPMIASLGYMEGFPATLLELATRRRGDWGPL